VFGGAGGKLELGQFAAALEIFRKREVHRIG
jgi:hypothetical protein